MQNTLTWLHLSDFHFKGGADWQQDVVLQSLIRDVIRNHIPELGLKPDMVVVTGDIARKGKADEYAVAKQYFMELASYLEHDPEDCWYLVPGNHDVDRDKIEIEQELGRDLFADVTKANKLVSTSRTWSNYAARQTAFFNFTGEFLGQDRA
ncbi:MAG: metallophosphoesterase [Acidobacteriota bacterium]|nr:metallophosphoesterase [Acidobacteriota bacterium]